VILKCNSLQQCYEFGHWHWRHKAKGGDAASPSGVVVDAKKVKSSAFELVYVGKGIRPVKRCSKTPISRGQPANPGSPGKWPLEQYMCNSLMNSLKVKSLV